MSNFTNVTDFTEFFAASDAVSGGILGIGIPVLMWIAMFGFALRDGREKALIYASFGTGIILMLENIAGITEYWLITADLLLLALGIFMLLHERGRFG